MAMNQKTSIRWMKKQYALSQFLDLEKENGFWVLHFSMTTIKFMTFRGIKSVWCLASTPIQILSKWQCLRLIMLMRSSLIYFAYVCMDAFCFWLLSWGLLFLSAVLIKKDFLVKKKRQRIKKMKKKNSLSIKIRKIDMYMILYKIIRILFWTVWNCSN
jgi:hypothetical protein